MKTLETERLILRPWKIEDVGDIYNIMKSPSVTMGGWEPHSDINKTYKVLRDYIDNEERWAIELKQTGIVIGSIGVCPDDNRGNYHAKALNFVLAEEYRGSGYITEALNCIIKYLFEEVGVELITAFHYPFNNPSRRVLEKCGLEYEGIIEHGCKRFDGKLMDAVCYSILKIDYYKKDIATSK